MVDAEKPPAPWPNGRSIPNFTLIHPTRLRTSPLLNVQRRLDCHTHTIHELIETEHMFLQHYSLRRTIAPPSTYLEVTHPSRSSSAASSPNRLITACGVQGPLAVKTSHVALSFAATRPAIVQIFSSNAATPVTVETAARNRSPEESLGVVCKQGAAETAAATETPSSAIGWEKTCMVSSVLVPRWQIAHCAEATEYNTYTGTFLR